MLGAVNPRDMIVMFVAGACAATALLCSGPQVQATESATAASLRTALHVPWALGGPRIEADGTRSEHPGEWPEQPVQAIRLWDTRTAWLHLEPAQDQWRFDHLDAHLAKARAHGVDHVTLVLWGTPTWAARDFDPQDAPWLGPGSAAPPRELADWLDYVTTVATRYRGRIDAYQLGNEPNNPMFWRGSEEELVAMVVQGAEAIEGIDPEVTVVAPAVLVTNQRQVAPAQPMWRALDRRTDAIDAWSMHWYPAPGTPVTELKAAIAQAPKPLWLTEVGLPATWRTLRQQRADLRMTRRVAQEAGAAYLAWYAWTDLGPHGLVHLQAPAVLRSALGLDQV